MLFLHFVSGIMEMLLELRKAADLVTKSAKLLVHQLHGSFNLTDSILPEIFFLSFIHIYNISLFFELFVRMAEKRCLVLIESALDTVHVS